MRFIWNRRDRTWLLIKVLSVDNFLVHWLKIITKKPYPERKLECEIHSQGFRDGCPFVTLDRVRILHWCQLNSSTQTDFTLSGLKTRVKTNINFRRVKHIWAPGSVTLLCQPFMESWLMEIHSSNNLVQRDYSNGSLVELPPCLCSCSSIPLC